MPASRNQWTSASNARPSHLGRETAWASIPPSILPRHDVLLTSDQRTQRLRNRDRPVCVLVVLQEGNEDPRARDDGVVQGVAQADASLPVAILQVEPSRLELVEA